MTIYLIVKVPEAVIVNHHVGGHETWQPPDGHIEVRVADDHVFDIGWLWNGEKAVDPNPVTVTNEAKTNPGGKSQRLDL